MISPDSSLLVILMGSLGDVARGLSIAVRIKRESPGVRITWLVEPACLKIVQSHPAVDEVILFERGKGISAVFTLARELRKHRFDICLDLQRHLKSGFFSFLSRVSRRIGFHPRDSKEGNWIFNTEYIDRYKNSIPKILHYHKFVDALGFTPVEEPDLSFADPLDGEALPASVDAYKGQYVVCLMGSRWESKDWPVAYYHTIFQLFSKNEIPVVLVGAKSQAEHFQSVSGKYVLNLIGTTSLLDLVGILRSAVCAFGPDSGPGHIAAGVRTPYITLFGPTDPLRVAPWGCENLSVSASVGCAPCWKKKCPGFGQICMKLLTPQIVFRRVRDVFESKTQRGEQQYG